MAQPGFDIKSWISIESDPKCREITRSIVPEHVLQTPTHNVNNIPNELYSTHIDCHINTSPCQPFSRLQDSPKGFRDKERTSPLIAAANLHTRLKQTNPDIKMMVENVEFHSSLQYDFQKFQKMWNGTAMPLNAKEVGSPSSRPRQFITDITDLGKIQHINPMSPNDLLEHHRHCENRHI